MGIYIDCAHLKAMLNSEVKTVIHEAPYVCSHVLWDTL